MAAVRNVALIYCALLTAFSLPAPSRATPSTCEWLPPHSGAARHTRADPPGGGPRSIVLFTDGTNFDDAVTLLFLAKSSRDKLLAVYLQGNAWASPGSSFRNMFNMLHMMGDDFAKVPIYAGSYYALEEEAAAEAAGEPGAPKAVYRSPVPFGSSGILYSDTLHGMAHYVPQGPAAYDIRTTPDEDAKSIPAFFDLLRTQPASERITLLSTGTLTPIAKMFTPAYAEEFEGLLPRLREVVVMGGAVDVPGNLFSKPGNVKAEFNIYNDPHAAQWAFKNLTDAGVRVALVPLDATNDVPLQERLLQELREAPRTPEAQLTGHLMENLRDTWFDPDAFFVSAYLWDPSAAIVAVRPGVVISKAKRWVRVVLEEGPDGERQGWTKPCDKREIEADMCAHIVVVEGLDGDLVTDTLLDTLQRRAGSAMRGLVCL